MFIHSLEKIMKRKLVIIGFVLIPLLFSWTTIEAQDTENISGEYGSIFQDRSSWGIKINEKKSEGFFHFRDIGPAITCDGVCLPRMTCIALGGVPKALCSPASHCCHFEKDCKEVTRNMLSYFQSPGYPAPTVGTLLCHHHILVQPGVCGVRLDFKEFNTTKPLDRGLCHMDKFLILNSLDGAAFARCGDLSGYSTIVPVESRQQVPLILLSLLQSDRETFRWNIRVTQMKCSSTRRIADYPSCGKKFSDGDAPPLHSTEAKETHVDGNEVENSITTQHRHSPNLDLVVDNAFSLVYLKRAYETLFDGPAPNPNQTLCKNAPAEKTKERIIRGQDALLHEFPWQVSIQDQKGHICGGAIINEYFIVTAAHCFISVVPVPLSKIRIVLGDLNLNSTTESQHIVAPLDLVLFHSHFDPYYLTNDIAVIRLRKPIQFRPGIQPVCLPEEGNSYAGQQALISGWGATNFPMGRLATHLQRVENDIIENAECKRVLKIDYIFRTMLCGLAPKCAGTCFGDSGGPLVLQNTKDGPSRLVGIVSFGIGGCALLPYWPDVYTRVSEYLDWLSYATTWT